jgi:hypothetical protein
METINFGKLIADAAIGTQLVKTNAVTDVVENGIWMNSSVEIGSSTYGMVFNTTKESLQMIDHTVNTDWAIYKDALGRPMMSDALTVSLLTRLASERLDYRASSKRADDYERALRTFKSNAQGALHDYAEEHGITGDSDSTEAFNEMLESIGLEGLKKRYTVSISVTYNVDVEVEASSERTAEEEVENNLGDLISESIDTSYYEDYTIQNIEEA